VPNLFRPILDASRIHTIFTTGKTGTGLFARLCVDEAGMGPVYLPSTSPANRATQAKPIYRELWSQVAAAADRAG
jgi:G:T/U-mismatch repair DNA glycosylase